MGRIIDSHVHIDMIAKYSLDSLYYYKNSNIITVSWSLWKEIKSTWHLSSYLECHRPSINSKACTLDIECYYLAGIHSRNIPKDFKMKQRILNALLYNLVDKRCLGIGEIGLEKVSALETKVLKV